MSEGRRHGARAHTEWALLLLLCTLAPSAHAEGAGLWMTLETRFPVARPSSPIPTFLRFQTQPRWSAPPVTLELIQLRAGPVWDLHENFRGALNLLVRAQNGHESGFGYEYRLELEPTLLLRLGVAHLSDRQRLEARWQSVGMHWRYRNQLALSLELEAAGWSPRASQEVFVNLSGEGLSESRTIVGLGRAIGEGSSLELGYQLLLQRHAEAWSVSHVLVLTLGFALPHTPPPPPATE